MTQNNLSVDEWRLVQDCIVENIMEIKNRRQWGYEENVETLQALLNKIQPNATKV